jgi:mycothiol system anti-sigma-R factor
MGAPEVGGCDEVQRHIWLYLDHETDPPACAELERHLSVCAICQRMVQFDRKFKMLVRRCADPGPVPRARVEALRLRVVAELRLRPPSQGRNEPPRS